MIKDATLRLGSSVFSEDKMSTLKKTVLHSLHREMGAKMIAFGDWDMPVNYGSQIEEHKKVRSHVGMFDVCHMTVIDLKGLKIRSFLSYLLANNVEKLKEVGQALYTCMLRPEGGIIDDLIVYFMEDNFFRLVVNAGTTDKDIKWLKEIAPKFDVEVIPRFDLGMIAVQGPSSRSLASSLFPKDLAERANQLTPFRSVVTEDWFVARTGYTGEDGFEIVLPQEKIVDLWRALAAAGVQPCGLGARDTLRLEAGMHLYGTDMDESTSPLESGLEWTVASDGERNFVGKSALEAQKESGKIRNFIAIILEDRGILRSHQKIFSGGVEIGETTSGGFSPTLQRSIGLARVSCLYEEPLFVEIRNKKFPVRKVKAPFVRNGEIKINI